MPLRYRERSLPRRALVISIGVLVIPVAAAFVPTETLDRDLGLFVWLAALIPAFLMAYYRGLKGVTVAVAAGMALLSITQAAVAVFGFGAPDWPLLLAVISVFLTIAVGLAVFAEILHRERRAAENMALTDALTGLPNRRYAELFMEKEFAAAMRGRSLCVLMFDIDFFKKFNDTHGHAAGDEVLQAFAEVLEIITRKQNVSARMGGEEFISILSGSEIDGAVIAAHKIREAIRDTKLKWGTVTVSVGAAIYREGMGSYHVLVAAADRALYVAKENGRDRVEVATDEEVRRPSMAMAAIPDAPARKTVLVVDSDAEERAGIAAIFERSGFDVEESGSPEDVVKLFEDRSRPVHVMVVNVLLSRISAFQLVDRVREFEPDLRVVYLASSMRGRVSWAGAPGLVARFVALPADPDELLSTVRATLEEDIPVPADFIS